ncbi:MerR family transcriptional regulator [Bacillus piscicola]|uniref:MerR family transcriptional regulator n=1 Tax=Bacillus piscicola TaxID=1632684 RepID=UPI001F09B2E4|nr:MerR family transcriptional regulator [Bacillus piscicola]
MDEFLKAYSIKEVSKQTGVPMGTIRQWETDFEGILTIQRDDKGARIYTDFEIETIKHIKTMRDKNLSKKVIRDLLQQKKESDNSSDYVPIPQPSVPKMNQSEAVKTLNELKDIMVNFDDFKESLKKELREEIRNEVKNEVVEEVRRELASASESQQKLVERGSKHTSEQLESISEALEKMEDKQEEEIGRRDKILMENMRLIKELKELKELKEEKSKGFFSKLFGK